MNSAFGSTRTAGNLRARSSAEDQCVVAGRPSSQPAAAIANAPVQMDIRRTSAGSRSRAAAVGSVSLPCPRMDGQRVPGITTVSAVRSASTGAFGAMA
jgi:hypothetical protein